MPETIAVKPNYGEATDWASSLTESGEVKAGSIWLEGTTASDDWLNLALDLDEAEELINGLAKAIAEIRKAEREHLPALPTKPGLYAPGVASPSRTLETLRLFTLSSYGDWRELTSDQRHNRLDPDDFQKLVRVMGGLVRLTVEENV